MCCGAFSLVSCIVTTCCGSLANEAGIKLKHAVKLSYTILIFAYSIFTFIILYKGHYILSWAKNLINCPKESLDSCLGISSVYR
jgi:hypothetical protein